MEFFLLDTLKTIFWMEILTQRWTLSESFFLNQSTFHDFLKRTGEAYPFPPCCEPESWSIKKLFLKILQYSQKNTCVRGFRTVILLKETSTQVFSCECCEIFKNIFFTEQLQVTTCGSWIWKHFLVVANLFFARRILKQLLWKAFVAIAIS